MRACPLSGYARGLFVCVFQVRSLSSLSMVPGPHHVHAVDSLLPSFLQDSEDFQGFATFLSRSLNSEYRAQHC